MDKTSLATGLTFVAAIGCGTIGGIFYAFSSFVMKALGRIPPQHGVAAMNSINIAVINPSFMLAFMGTTLVCAALAVGSYFWWQQPGGKLVFAAALLYLVGAFGVTMVFNQPLNLKLAGMEPAQAAAFWPQYVETWTLWNHVRTAASLLASALLVVVSLVMK